MPAAPPPAGAAFTERDWERLLSAELRATVEVRYTRARRYVLEMGPEGSGDAPGARRLKMNRRFAEAPPDVRDAVVRWLRSGRRARRASDRLGEWIDATFGRPDPAARPRVTVRQRGEAHDLGPLAAELLREEFDGEFGPDNPEPTITWGRAVRGRARHSLRLGSFDYTTRILRVHPVLDQGAVPRWFVRFVLFHELLHAALPVEVVGGRRQWHGPAFRRRERAYADTARAEAWERRHLRALIRSARTGKPLRGRADDDGRGRARAARPASPETPPRGWRQGWLFDVLAGKRDGGDG